MIVYSRVLLQGKGDKNFESKNGIVSKSVFISNLELLF